MGLFGKKTQDVVSVTYVSHSGVTKQLEIPAGKTVMEGAINNGVEGIVAECGGSCMCSTCHVYVDDAFLERLEPMADDEDAMLDNAASPRLPNSRLGCQIQLTPALSGLVVRTPERQEK